MPTSASPRPVSFKVSQLPEPLLRFANGGTSQDPREGLTLHGPFSRTEPGQHPSQLRLGVVGSGEGIEGFERWLTCAKRFIPTEVGSELLHPSFPGFNPNSPFASEFVLRASWTLKITHREQLEITNERDPIARFLRALDLLTEKVRHIAQRDGPPDVVVIVLPLEIYRGCRAVTVPFQGNSRQGVFRDFRRALKARVMKWGVPTQLLLPSVFEPSAKLQPFPTRAWNLCTALYYKAGGYPWILDDLEDGTCFLGISFHRHMHEAETKMYSSLAQIFSNHAEGVVLRGQPFEWDTELGRSPHLDEAGAAALVELALERFKADHGHPPRRVVVHKTSTFWEEELAGFTQALAPVQEYDLLALAPGGVRLFREGNYPPLRGTYARIAEDAHVLYTTGYTPFLRSYPKGYVPQPIEIRQHVGGSAKSRLCQELLALTKMDWNCTDFATQEPITLRFARSVGFIMAELESASETPHPSFKFYM